VFESVLEPAPDEPIILVQYPDPILVEHSARFELGRTGKNIDRLDEDGLPSVQIFGKIKQKENGRFLNI
jgi:hypothetical protein